MNPRRRRQIIAELIESQGLSASTITTSSGEDPKEVFDVPYFEVEAPEMIEPIVIVSPRYQAPDPIDYNQMSYDNLLKFAKDKNIKTKKKERIIKELKLLEK